MKMESAEKFSHWTPQEMLDGDGIAIETDAPIQRISLNIELLDSPAEADLETYFRDGGWTIAEELSVEMSGDIYVRDDTSGDSTLLGRSDGPLRARVCVGRMAG
ncbi:MAG: hypothetical protein ABI384_02075, partial [Allobranchiibius sp.]